MRRMRQSIRVQEAVHEAPLDAQETPLQLPVLRQNVPIQRRLETTHVLAHERVPVFGMRQGVLQGQLP